MEQLTLSIIIFLIICTPTAVVAVLKRNDIAWDEAVLFTFVATIILIGVFALVYLAAGGILESLPQ